MIKIKKIRKYIQETQKALVWAGQGKFHGDLVYADRLSPFNYAIEAAEGPLSTMVGV